MKIAICGPEATGKSTLAAALAERLGLPLVADPRVELLRSSTYDTLFEAARLQPRLWEDLVRGQARLEAGIESGVFDGGAIDAFSLWVRWGWNSASPETTEELTRLVSEAVSEYSHILIMPAVQVAPFKGHRFFSQLNADHMLAMVRGMLTQLGVSDRALLLSPGDAERLVDQAASFVAEAPNS